ncbi:MAG TPA: serine/threonine-protein kinase [Myxococcales bacterium]
MTRQTLGLDEVALPPKAAPLAIEGSTGVYRLRRPLGEGAVGEVWLADQEAPVRRPVAVKLIKAGMDSQRVLARFQAERQALAMMSHPSIARIFDGGTTEEGRPYFVMECVEGKPINEHCDANALELAGRLRLLQDVCDAVQHAHQKGIIHRDLKPSNVLVAGGSPRVIDFGIAKALSEPLSDAPCNTEIGTLMGTPEYMSPEQAGGAEDIDTRADVYSLGVMLYELACGALPFSSRELRRGSVEELRRKIGEEDPPLPSVRFAALPDKDAVARRRCLSAAALERALTGDLDAIAMKAMEKDRSRRYGSASELSADLTRLLAGEPVLARPSSALYRLRKYARRHRAGVAVFAAAALLLPAFTVGLGFQVRQVSRERDRANREAAASKRATDFMSAMFAVADPFENRGQTITAREVLDRATAEIKTSLERDPAMRSRLMTAMGHIYLNLTLYPQARPLIEEALAERRVRLGADHPETLESAAAMGRLLSHEGKTHEAEQVLRDTAAAERRVLGKDGAALLVATLNDLSAVYSELGRPAEAEPIDREALNAAQSLPEGNREALRALRVSAATLYDLGRYPEAEQAQRRVYARAERIFGPDAALTVDAMASLAATLDMERRFDEAEKLLRATWQRQRQIFGADHSATLNTASNLAHALMQLHREPEAEQIERDTLAARERVLGPNHPETLISLDTLGRILKREKRYREAEPVLQRAADARAATLGPHAGRTAESRYNLACNQALSDRPQEALASLRSAVPDLPLFEAGAVADDGDFAALHGMPEFEAIVAEAKERAAASRAAAPK